MYKAQLDMNIMTPTELGESWSRPAIYNDQTLRRERSPQMVVKSKGIPSKMALN